MLSRVWIVRISAHYDYDQECHGILRCFEFKSTAEEFVNDLQENWKEFLRTFNDHSNRWGGHFFMSMNPQGFEGVEIEEWPVYEE